MREARRGPSGVWSIRALRRPLSAPSARGQAPGLRTLALQAATSLALRHLRGQSGRGGRFRSALGGDALRGGRSQALLGDRWKRPRARSARRRVVLKSRPASGSVVMLCGWGVERKSSADAVIFDIFSPIQCVGWWREQTRHEPRSGPRSNVIVE